MMLIAALIGVGALAVLWAIFGVQVARWVDRRHTPEASAAAAPTKAPPESPPVTGHELYDGLRVTSWRYWGGGQRDFELSDGTAVRDNHGYKWYPSGKDVYILGKLYGALRAFEQQIEWGQHQHLERKGD